MRKDGRGWAIQPTGEYPTDWTEIAKRLKESVDWQCEHCGNLFFPNTNIAMYDVNVKGRPIILTIHHLDGNKADCSFENCLVCCQRCHLIIQRIWGPGDPLPPQWETPPEWMIRRNLAFQPRQQLDLLPPSASSQTAMGAPIVRIGDMDRIAINDGIDEGHRG